MPDPDGPEPTYPLPVRVRRALARRFPRTRIAWNQVRAQAGHQARRLRGLASRARFARARATIRWLAALCRQIAARRAEPRLTVAVEIAAFWEPLTGIGWYLFRLLEHLADRDDLRVRLYGPSVVSSHDLPGPTVLPPAGPALEPVRIAVPDDLLLPAGLLIPLLRRLEPALIALDGNRVLFAPNYFLPRRFQLATGARVATVHDLGLRKVPWTLRPETLRDLTEKLEHSLFESTRLISVSAAVRSELSELGYAAPARVSVIHHGPGQLAGVEPSSLPRSVPAPFALHVGTLEPRKNVLVLIEAWKRLRLLAPGAPHLVLCGRLGWKAGRIRTAIEEAAREGWLTHLGYVSDPELAALYQTARLVVFPTLYEGFGLPAVEAQHAGAPLVCSDIPALREAAGAAALFVPAERPEAIAAAVRRLLDDDALARRLSSEGRARAATLSWRTAAERTAAVFGAAAGLGPPPAALAEES
jgi:alpha-1,3-rhamnosyl/mannosyltransferase